MNIPKTFKLMGQEIEVKFIENLRDETDCTGEAIFRQNKIRIQPSVNGNPRPKSIIAQTFCHELIHFIFHMMGEDKLRKDEKFIEVFSGLLLQALDTMDYPSSKRIIKHSPRKGTIPIEQVKKAVRNVREKKKK